MAGKGGASLLAARGILMGSATSSKTMVLVLEKYDMEGLRKNGTKNTGTRDQGDPQRTRLCSDNELL